MRPFTASLRSTVTVTVTQAGPTIRVGGHPGHTVTTSDRDGPCFADPAEHATGPGQRPWRSGQAGPGGDGGFSLGQELRRAAAVRGLCAACWGKRGRGECRRGGGERGREGRGRRGERRYPAINRATHFLKSLLKRKSLRNTDELLSKDGALVARMEAELPWTGDKRLTSGTKLRRQRRKSLRRWPTLSARRIKGGPSGGPYLPGPAPQHQTQHAPD